MMNELIRIMIGFEKFFFIVVCVFNIFKNEVIVVFMVILDNGVGVFDLLVKVILWVVEYVILYWKLVFIIVMVVIEVIWEIFKNLGLVVGFWVVFFG